MLRLKDLAQEKRQTTIKEQVVEIEVTVTREDFPLQKAQIQIRYFPSCAQEAWEKFLSDVTKELKLDFIYSILERGDKAPIYRIIMLKNQAEYLVRQRENSAVLEILNEGVAPMEISWEITRDIVHVKKDLEFNIRTNPITQDRILNLVTKPITSLNQKTFVERLLKTTKPKDIVDDINKLYLPGLETWSPEYTSGLVTLDYSQTQKLEKEYDMVTVHRLCLEQLDRLCSQGFEAIVAKQAVHYVFKSMQDLADEPDIIALALKITADLARFLLKQRDGIFTAVLNVMQHYAPLAPAHRPRKPKRLAMTMNTHQLSSQKQLAPAPTNYDITGMFVDPSAYENKPVSRGNNNNMKITQIADNSLVNSVVDAIFAKRDAQIQQTRRTLLNKPPADLFQLSRYGEFYASDKERSHLRGVTNKAIGYAQRIDFDEHSLRPITPKMRKLMEEEEKTKIRLEKEEAEKKKQREILQRELEMAEKSQPKVILQQRDRVDAHIAKANLQHAKDNDAAVSMLSFVSPSFTQHKQISDQNNSHSENISKNSITNITSSTAVSYNTINLSSKNLSNDRFNFASIGSKVNNNNESINRNVENEGGGNDSDDDDDDDDLRSFKPSLPAITGTGKPGPPPLMKMTSIIRSAPLNVTGDEEAKQMPAEKKKLVSITIHKKQSYNESANTINSNSSTWSGTKGTVGKRFDPSAFSPKPVLLTNDTGNNLKKDADSKDNQQNEPSHENDGSDEEKEYHLTGDNNEKTRDQHILPKLVASPPPPDVDSLSITSRNNNFTATNDYNNSNLNNVDDIKPIEDAKVRAWVPSIATLIKRAKKVKFVKQPLPVAPRATFRAFDHQMPTNFILTAALAALLQILLVNYGNREWAFQHGLIAEVAEVVLDCSAMPKLFEYFIDIIEILYREGLGDPVDSTQLDAMDRMDMFDQQLDSASFLSAMVSDIGVVEGKLEGHSVSNLDNDSTANITVLDAMSEMSLPTVDAEIVWTQVHDQEAARLVELSNNPQAKHKNKPRKDDNAEGSDSDEEKQDNPHSDDLYQPGEIIIQKITDKDSQRSLDALASNDGQDAGVNTQRPVVDISASHNIVNTNIFNKNAVATNNNNGGRPSILTTHSSMSNNNNNVNNVHSMHPSLMSSPGTVTTGKFIHNSQNGAHFHGPSQHSTRPSFTSTISNISASKRSKKSIGEMENNESGYRLYVKSTLRDRVGRNRELVQALGLCEFDARYRQVPEDSVIIALSMTMHHVEVAPRWRELAEFWLEFWADGSRDYKILILKGRNLCGL